jgi:hypothetical protein
MAMNKMNPVDTGIHPIDGGSQRYRSSALIIIAAALAVLVGGGMVLYSF